MDYNYKYYSDGELVITARLAEGIEDIVLPDKHMDFGMLMGINVRSNANEYQNFWFFDAANSIESSVVKECKGTELTDEESFEISDKFNEESYQALKDVLINKEDFEKGDVSGKWFAVDAEKDTLHAGEKLFSYTFERYGADEVTICHSGTSFKINPKNGGVVNFTASNDSIDGYQNGLPELEQVDKFCQPHILPEFVSDSEPTTEDTSETTGSELTVTKYGDVDCDGDTSILDVILANRNILGKSTVTKQGVVNGDLDSSGALEPSDSLSIMKLIVGILTEDDLKPTEPTEDTTETTISETTTESAETTETAESTTEAVTTEPEETTAEETTAEDPTEMTEEVTEEVTEETA